MRIQIREEEIVSKMKAIFNEHKKERICVLGTSCCGKTTLMKWIPGCVDLDDELFPQLTKEESEFICSKPWTEDIGHFVDKLVHERISIKPGHPLFTTSIVECDVLIYIDINDELLAEHCKKRGVNFIDSKNMKESIEEDLNDYKERGENIIYHLIITNYKDPSDMLSIHEYEDKNLIVADLVKISDNKEIFIILDNDDQVLFDGRVEDLRWTKDGVAHELCGERIRAIEVSNDCKLMIAIWRESNEC